MVSAVRGPHSARLYPASKPHPDYRHDASRRLALTPDEIADRCLGSAPPAPALPGRTRALAPSAGLRDKRARYDALITGWARSQEPFLSAGLPPAVIFVFPDEPMTIAVAKLADALVRGRIASLEDRQTASP